MKTILNKFNEEPYILHLPGNGLKDFYHYISFLENKDITYNENIHIIFICTPNIDSPLEKQLIKNNIPYTNVVSYINDDYLKIFSHWNWIYKHIAIKRFLNDEKTLKTKNINDDTYFIVLDASDVFINKLEDIVKTYRTYYNKKYLFCGTKSDYPNECFFNKNYNNTPTVKSNFCIYINCGGYMCNKKYLQILTESILKYHSSASCGDFKFNPVLIDDDQYICKVMQKRHALGYDKIIVDDYCRIFQSASARTNICENNEFIIID